MRLLSHTTITSRPQRRAINQNRGFGPINNGRGNKMSIRKFDILDRIEVFDDSYEVAHAVRNCSEESFVYWRAEAEVHIIGLWEYAKDLRTENLRLRKLGGLKNG